MSRDHTNKPWSVIQRAAKSACDAFTAELCNFFGDAPLSVDVLKSFTFGAHCLAGSAVVHLAAASGHPIAEVCEDFADDLREALARATAPEADQTAH